MVGDGPCFSFGHLLSHTHSETGMSTHSYYPLRTRCTHLQPLAIEPGNGKYLSLPRSNYVSQKLILPFID